MKLSLDRFRSPLLKTPREIQPSGRGMRNDKAAFLVSYGEAATFSRSIVELTRGLSRRGYDVVLVRASGSGVKASWPNNEEAIRPTIVYRPNVGYDFGSWAIAIQSFPKLAARSHVLLLNDSLVGPFGSLDPLLDHFEKSQSDIWSATSTLQFEPHLQSFFLGFRRGILRKYPLRRFWSLIREVGTKEEIILAYEIGLTRLAVEGMLTTDVYLPAEFVVRGELNPAIDGWKELLDNGFPFVKRELLRVEQFGHLRAQIIDDIERRHGENPMEWFETV